MEASIAARANDTLEGGVRDQRRKDKALSLLQECRDYDVPPPKELIELVASFIGDDRRNTLPKSDNKTQEYIARLIADDFGVPPSQVEKFRKAARFEAENPTSAVNAVANHAEIDRKTVREYRKKESYKYLISQYSS